MDRANSTIVEKYVKVQHCVTKDKFLQRFYSVIDKEKSKLKGGWYRRSVFALASEQTDCSHEIFVKWIFQYDVATYRECLLAVADALEETVWNCCIDSTYLIRCIMTAVYIKKLFRSFCDMARCSFMLQPESTMAFAKEHQ